MKSTFFVIIFIFSSATFNAQSVSEYKIFYEFELNHDYVMVGLINVNNDTLYALSYDPVRLGEQRNKIFANDTLFTLHLMPVTSENQLNISVGNPDVTFYIDQTKISKGATIFCNLYLILIPFSQSIYLQKK